MSPYLSTPSAPDADGPSQVHHAFPHIHEDPAALPSSLDPFTITTSTGFMPLHDPVVSLPEVFRPMAKIIEDMPVVKEDGSPGLLATYQLGPLIDQGGLPDFTDEIDNLVTNDGEPDMSLVTAVFRDYSFLASSYLLEPCWERWSKGLEGYGLGRQVLPKVLAGPLVKTAKILDVPAFMSYAAAYSLYNYKLADPSAGLSTYENLRLVRAFEKGLDPASSEAGFILTHVAMVSTTGGLITGATQLLDAVSSKTRSSAIDAFDVLLSTMETIETSMEAMWNHSRPAEYISYRTFIYGIKSQSMFPNGVTYQVSLTDESQNHPQFFRGESGANDSIIPLLDHLLQIPMPSNPLTEILKDFRSYRPKPHREFLTYVRERSEELGVRSFCCENGDGEENVELGMRYLRLLEHVRSFRWRHWLFAREYIIKRTKYPTATGGSPIVTWLPNQLMAVMDLMCGVWERIQGDVPKDERQVRIIMENVVDAREKLAREVEKYCVERGVSKE